MFISNRFANEACYIISGTDNTNIYFIWIVTYNILSVAVPFTIIVIVYGLALKNLNIQTKSLLTTNNSLDSRRLKKDKKITKMFVILVSMFFILTMPYAIYYTYTTYLLKYKPEYYFENIQTVASNNTELFITMAFNSCVNPIIYSKIYRHCFCCRKPPPAPSTRVNTLTRVLPETHPRRTATGASEQVAQRLIGTEAGTHST